ncbi:hypothetical protein STRTUCAR8_05070 [Streptomyces turgidiscabies Car8]|uniref:Uncharacterized protein n=1 Tax=Streptomyces turgidiscabies (strain Car8) TaxID=698760 RepID=L7FII0_STRT8|nr:hypothetical protein STRTUCAR8_05070 [Streptomyces turgidiscabies Car8]
MDSPGSRWIARGRCQPENPGNGEFSRESISASDVSEMDSPRRNYFFSMNVR